MNRESVRALPSQRAAQWLKGKDRHGSRKISVYRTHLDCKVVEQVSDYGYGQRLDVVLGGTLYE